MHGVLAAFLLFISVSCSQEQEAGQLGDGQDSSPRIEFSGESLTVGTFNIKWLGDGKKDRTPRTEAEYEMIAAAIRDTDADIMALQEIENGAALERLQKYLPDFNYLINSRGAQRVAFIYRNSLSVKKIEEFDELAISSGLRPGLIVECNTGNFDCRLMAVHFKATSRYDNTEQKRQRSYNIRRQQSELVNDWVKATLAAGDEDDIVVLGDFNDNPIDEATPTLTVLEENPEFTFLTSDVPSCKNAKWTSIDHIGVTPAMAAMADEASIGTYGLYHRYKREVAAKISDHCPVLVRFDLAERDAL